MALVALKRELSAELRQALPQVVSRELEMHARCFADPEVQQQVGRRVHG